MEYVKKRAWDLSKSLEMNDFPFDALSLNGKNLGFVIASYNNSKKYIKVKKLDKFVKKYDGFAVKDDDGIVILYSDSLHYSKRNKVIMHEVGHVIMGHTSYNNILGHNSDQAVLTSQEEEANLFAISFLAPAPKLISKGVVDSVSIARLTGLSVHDSDLIAVEIQCEQKILQKAKLKQLKKYIYSVCCGILIFALVGIIWDSLHNNTIYSEPVSTNEALNPNKTQESSSTFYVTKTGEKYHLEICRYVKNKGTPISLEDIKKEGYTACKVCNPPI